MTAAAASVAPSAVASRGPLLAAASSAVAALTAWGGDLWWPCAALEPFAPALAFLAVVAATWCLYRRRLAPALVALTAALLLGLPVLDSLRSPGTPRDGLLTTAPRPASTAPSDASGPSGRTSTRFRLVLVNAWSVNPRPQVLVEWIEASGADVVVVVELTPDLERRLAPLTARLPHRLGQARDDNFGLGVWSRCPLEDGRLLHLDDTDRPTIVARLRPGNRLRPGDLLRAETPSLTLVAVHPPPPRHGRYHAMRTRILDATADLVRATSDPVVVVGDLNSVPWSAAFRRFTDRSGLLRAGAGFLPTWPAFVPPLWVPLDHVLTGPGVLVERLAAGPFVWSDHFPLVADLSLAP